MSVNLNLKYTGVKRQHLYQYRPERRFQDAIPEDGFAFVRKDVSETKFLVTMKELLTPSEFRQMLKEMKNASKRQLTKTTSHKIKTKKTS